MAAVSSGALVAFGGAEVEVLVGGGPPQAERDRKMPMIRIRLTYNLRKTWDYTGLPTVSVTAVPNIAYLSMRGVEFSRL
jgi:hypothetical protein